MSIQGSKVDSKVDSKHDFATVLGIIRLRNFGIDKKYKQRLLLL